MFVNHSFILSFILLLFCNFVCNLISFKLSCRKPVFIKIDFFSSHQQGVDSMVLLKRTFHFNFEFERGQKLSEI